ncbi:MAG TPA: CocE/NonD family hydrolase, partial [Blastocatellia bacterium]|nr:CocE/NonD family hydrolase [Blastocatellia bacterium]
MSIKLKYSLVAVLLIPLLDISRTSSNPTYAGQIEFVDVSTHFIEVAGGSAGPQPLRLAATLYQPRFLPSAPAAIYIHGWGGRRLLGTDNLAYQISAAGYVVLSYTARGFGEGESGGQVSLAGPDELNDLSRVIDWLQGDPDHVITPRVTRIGVIGGSYGGG